MSADPRPRAAQTSHTLPNGLTVACLRKGEVDFVYHEIFESRVYMKHGITLPPGACVLDVGANIGLFTLFVMQVRPDATVHAFEPSPELCDLFRANTAAHSASVRLHPCGLSSADGDASFTFYPGYSILSGFHADAGTDRVMLRAALRNQFRAKFGPQAEPEDRHLDSLIAEMLRGRTESTRRLRSLSGIIDEHGIGAIDLLKVDAEKCEHEILRGIEDRHWETIRQIVIEVHDTDGAQLRTIAALLGRRGFSIKTEVEPQFDNASIVNVYAVR